MKLRQVNSLLFVPLFGITLLASAMYVVCGDVCQNGQLCSVSIQTPTAPLVLLPEDESTFLKFVPTYQVRKMPK